MKKTFIVTVDIDDDEEVNKVRTGIEYAILDCLSLKATVELDIYGDINSTIKTNHQVCRFIREIGGVGAIKEIPLLDTHYIELTSINRSIYESYNKRNPKFEESLLRALQSWPKGFKEYYINFINERKNEET
jgi:hypothetical protein